MLFFSLTSHERQLLEGFVECAVLSNEARRAQALLWLDDGETAQVVAVRLGASRQTIYNWAHRFKHRPCECDIKVRLADGKRSGRPSTLSTRGHSLGVSLGDQPSYDLGIKTPAGA